MIAIVRKVFAHRSAIRFAIFWCAVVSAPGALAANAGERLLQHFTDTTRDLYSTIDCDSATFPLQHTGEGLIAASPCYHFDSGSSPVSEGRTVVDRRIGAVNHLRFARLLKDEKDNIVALYQIRLQTMEMLKMQTLSLKDLRAVFSENATVDSENCSDTYARIDKRRYTYARTCSAASADERRRSLRAAVGS